MSLLEFLGMMALVAVVSLALIAVWDIVIPDVLAVSLGRSRSGDSRARKLTKADARATFQNS